MQEEDKCSLDNLYRSRCALIWLSCDIFLSMFVRNKEHFGVHPVWLLCSHWTNWSYTKKENRLKHVKVSEAVVAMFKVRIRGFQKHYDNDFPLMTTTCVWFSQFLCVSPFCLSDIIVNEPYPGQPNNWRAEGWDRLFEGLTAQQVTKSSKPP